MKKITIIPVFILIVCLFSCSKEATVAEVTPDPTVNAQANLVDNIT
jgi:PBP1b-binding outer membrane lipoprotein LpoB